MKEKRVDDVAREIAELFEQEFGDGGFWDRVGEAADMPEVDAAEKAQGIEAARKAALDWHCALARIQAEYPEAEEAPPRYFSFTTQDYRDPDKYTTSVMLWRVRNWEPRARGTLIQIVCKQKHTVIAFDPSRVELAKMPTAEREAAYRFMEKVYDELEPFIRLPVFYNIVTDAYMVATYCLFLRLQAKFGPYVTLMDDGTTGRLRRERVRR